VALPRRSAGALIRLRVDDAQRFAGLLLGAQRFFELVEAHDEDWFDNPRAADQLRSEARLVPAVSADPDRLGAASLSLSAWLERAL
jgi:hypothetical protein